MLSSRQKKKALDKLKRLVIIIDRRIEFKVHIRKAINKAEHVFRAVIMLSGTILGIRSSTFRLIYLAYVKMVMEYGCETWIDSNLSQIFKKLVSIQYEALKRVAEVYNDPASHLLKKEATTLSLRI